VSEITRTHSSIGYSLD